MSEPTTTIIQALAEVLRKKREGWARDNKTVESYGYWHMLSQEEAARRAGVHLMTVSEIERAAQGDVGIVTLVKLAKAYGMRASEVLAAAEVAAGLAESPQKVSKPAAKVTSKGKAPAPNPKRSTRDADAMALAFKAGSKKPATKRKRRK